MRTFRGKAVTEKRRGGGPFPRRESSCHKESIGIPFFRDFHLAFGKGISSKAPIGGKFHCVRAGFVSYHKNKGKRKEGNRGRIRAREKGPGIA